MEFALEKKGGIETYAPTSALTAVMSGVPFYVTSLWSNNLETQTLVDEEMCLQKSWIPKMMVWQR